MKRTRLLGLFLVLAMLVTLATPLLPQALAAGTPTAIELNVNSLTLEPADAFRATAVVRDENGDEIQDALVTWSSSADGVARVSQSVAGATPGGQITATQAAETKS